MNEDLVSVCFTTPQKGWVLSEEGTLLSTDNAGMSWQTTGLGSGTFTGVCFTGPDHGCVTGYDNGSFILLTTNGGADWTQIGHEQATRLNDVYFHDSQTGWTVGIKDGMNFNLYTDDGGQTWTPQMDIFVMDAELFGVSFRDALSGDVCGADGAFFSTNSGGTSGWAMNISIPSLGVDLYSVSNWGMFNGCAVGEDGTALYTTNKWSSYIETTTNVGQDLHAVSAAPGTNKLWAAGEDGIIIHTPNYIFGWMTQVSGVTEDLNDIHMLDENNGWAVGDNGTILRYGLLPGIVEDDVSRLTIYPNPARGRVNIHLPVEGPQRVKVVLCDVGGREMATVIDRELPGGEHVVQFDTRQLTAGIYFLKTSVCYTPSVYRSSQGIQQLSVDKLLVLD